MTVTQEVGISNIRGRWFNLLHHYKMPNVIAKKWIFYFFLSHGQPRTINMHMHVWNKNMHNLYFHVESSKLRHCYTYIYSQPTFMTFHFIIPKPKIGVESPTLSPSHEWQLWWLFQASNAELYCLSLRLSKSF